MASSLNHRGTRWTLDDLPEGWIELGHATRKKVGLPRINLQIEAANFVDYWKSRVDKESFKLDWLAAWRRWARNVWRGVPEATPAAEQSCGCDQDLALKRAKLAAKGIRSAYLCREDLQLGVSHGVITEEQAKRFGL